MHTIIHSRSPSRRRPEAPTSVSSFRQPSYDCNELPDAVKLAVYVPGVEASGVEIEARGPDLLVTARKPHFVRVNWEALHLERAQNDYHLRLRLGHAFDYPALRAEIGDGVLTVTLPKRLPADVGGSTRRAA